MPDDLVPDPDQRPIDDAEEGSDMSLSKGRTESPPDEHIAHTFTVCVEGHEAVVEVHLGLVWACWNGRACWLPERPGRLLSLLLDPPGAEWSTYEIADHFRPGDQAALARVREWVSDLRRRLNEAGLSAIAHRIETIDGDQTHYGFRA